MLRTLVKKNLVPNRCACDLCQAKVFVPVFKTDKLEERTKSKYVSDVIQSTLFRASSYEPGNRAGSVTGTNFVVCSYGKFQPG